MLLAPLVTGGMLCGYRYSVQPARRQGEPAATPHAAQLAGDPRSGTGWAIECSRRAKTSCH